MSSRTKDWADLEEMRDAGSLDRQAVLGVLTDYLGTGDERIERLRSLEKNSVRCVVAKSGSSSGLPSGH